MRLIKFILFIFILFSFSFLNAQDRDSKLNELFNELKINNVTLTSEDVTLTDDLTLTFDDVT